VLALKMDAPGPAQVLIRSAEANVWLIVLYTLG
jgi:hypothetical protein